MGSNEDDLKDLLDDFIDECFFASLHLGSTIDNMDEEISDDIFDNHSESEVSSSSSFVSGSDVDSCTSEDSGYAPSSSGGHNRGRHLQSHRYESSLVFQFTRSLLRDPRYCPGIIYWDNYEEKIFCFRNTKKVGQLYAEFRRNPRMTYANYTRAIRYHYENAGKKLGSPVLFLKHQTKKKYRFGPDATGLETDDPNFVRYRQNRKFYQKSFSYIL